MPFKEYQTSIKPKLEALRKEIALLKKEPSLHRLEVLHNEIRRIGAGAALYGDDEAAKLAHQLELEFIGRVRNFQKEALSAQEQEKIENLFLKIEERLLEKEESSMAPAKRTIVLVDDDEDLLKLLAFEFHNLGFEVKSFVTGTTALAFLSQDENLKNVPLVILDRILPDMDGLEILKGLKSNSHMKVPVLILSVLSGEENIMSGLQLGAVDYITKPFSVFLLLQKAMNLMAAH
ncbi:MAG: response regulator [Verrucomicrobiota bacterium]|nr:response regulator [Verrucomicrobiota bacterium]